MFSQSDSPEKMLEILYKKGFTHLLTNGFKYPIMIDVLNYRIKMINKNLYNNMRIFTSKYVEEVYRSAPDKSGWTTYIYKINYDSLKSTELQNGTGNRNKQ